MNNTGEAKKEPRLQWCATADKFRCMRCGRISKNMKMQGTSEGSKWLREDSKHGLGLWSNARLGGHDMVGRVDRHESGYVRQRLGPQLMKQCKPEKVRGRMFLRILTLEEGRVLLSENTRGWRIEGQKKRVHLEGMQETSGGV